MVDWRKVDVRRVDWRRIDLQGVATRAAAQVAEVRERTVLDTVREVRRLLPGDSRFGDPLSRSGTGAPAAVARLAVRWLDRLDIVREMSLAMLQIADEVGDQRRRDGAEPQCTLVFTDLVGFSGWALRAGDDDLLLLLRSVASGVEPALLARGGRVVKRMGDGLMAVFDDAQFAFDAVEAARAELENVEIGGHRPRLRVGLHTGRPRVIGGDYFGTDVNVAARLAEWAQSDETLVSGATLELLDPERTNFRRRPTTRLSDDKGVPNDLDVYDVWPSEPAHTSTTSYTGTLPNTPGQLARALRRATGRMCDHRAVRAGPLHHLANVCADVLGRCSTSLSSTSQRFARTGRGARQVPWCPPR